MKLEFYDIRKNLHNTMEIDPGNELSIPQVFVALCILSVLIGSPFVAVRMGARISVSHFYFLALVFVILGVAVWIRWKHGPTEAEQRQTDTIVRRTFHWTVGIPADRDQYYIFVLSLAGDLFIFWSVLGVLNAYRFPSEPGIMMALISALVFHLSKLLHEIDLFAYVRPDNVNKMMYLWRKLINQLIGLVGGGVILVGLWYVHTAMWNMHPFERVLVLLSYGVFYGLGGVIHQIDIGFMNEKAGGSLLIKELFLMCALLVTVLLCALHSAFLITVIPY